MDRLAICIIEYMRRKNHQVFDGQHEFNIIYVEGINADGTLNNDAPNQWNDRRILITFQNGEPKIVGNWAATTEPGIFYTYHLLNPKGCARIAFGQYKAWQVGTHGNSEPHESLVQVCPVTVHRDLNKDAIRTGDKLDIGLFGINQHWGYDMPQVGKASAGCLVGQSRAAHRKFMSLVKSDRRYKADKNFIFSTTVIAGDDLLKK